MKATKILMITALVAIAAASCNQQSKQELAEVPALQPDGVFPKGSKIDNENFTGVAWLHMLLPVDSVFNTQMAMVTFEPGTRTNWHTHPSGQILVITHGSAYYQEKGKPRQILSKGQVATCAPGATHWHGASPESSMSHIVVSPDMEKGSVVWLKKVTDEEYEGSN